MDNHASTYPTADSKTFSSGGRASLSTLQDIFSWEDDTNQCFDLVRNNVSFCWDRGPFRYNLKLAQSFSCKTNVTLFGNHESMRASGRLKTLSS